MVNLVIGGSGFVGGHLIKFLKSKEEKAYATKLNGEGFFVNADDVFDLDILNEDDIFALLSEVRPTCIYHLAAQSSVKNSWDNPNLTIDVNVCGVINLLNAVRRLDYKPRVLLVGSSDEYGGSLGSDVSEKNRLEPLNIYAVSKTAGEMIGKIYVKAYDMDIVMTRSFSHTGPGQSPNFVIPSFCKQVADIEKGAEPVLYVGNLDVKRDFTDVRDVVRAYHILMNKGVTGEVYNVGSGIAYSLKELLEKIIGMSSKDIEVRIDKDRFRPIDLPLIISTSCS